MTLRFDLGSLDKFQAKIRNIPGYRLWRRCRRAAGSFSNTHTPGFANRQKCLDGKAAGNLSGGYIFSMYGTLGQIRLPDSYGREPLQIY